MSLSLVRFATTPVLASAALLLAASTARAQSFNVQAGALTEKIWTEGVECADVDNDGDLDIAFANGDGFSSAGTQRQNKLYINQLEIAAGMYADESVARLGSVATNAKGVIAGDIHNDGWVDLLYANAFNNALPGVYFNKGAMNPGFFTLRSVAAGFTENLNSASAGFADLDNDGDLDVIINDSGNAYLGGAGDEPRLYFNNGSGIFTEDAAAMNAPAKDSQMDVQFVDLDGDWDLDFFGVCRGTNTGGNHYLMLNDGAGNFTDVSSLIPATSTNVYEAEIGDLDGDTDPDMFFVSASGLAEGHVRNNFFGSGVLTFTKGATFSGDDDNEAMLFDYDNDDDYDVVIGSLASREKLFRNDGSLTWTVASGAIQAVSDSTLDGTIADLDNDGDYDIITAQGESNSNQWDNKIYVNSGSPDTRLPIIVRTEPLGGLPNETGPWVVRGEVRDQVMDDGKNWVRAEADYVVLTQPSSVSVSMAGFSFVPANINITAGTTVIWDNPTPDLHTVTSTDPSYSYNSGFLAQGETFEHTFVRPGVYNYHCIPHQGFGMVGTVTVTGTSTNVAATYSNGGIYRFGMTDTASGAGVQLAYELRFTDWAGNASVSTSELETIIPCGFTQYDVGASPANTVDLNGTGSTSLGNPFSIVATNVTGFATLFGISLGKANYPFLGGVGLIDPFQILVTRIRGVVAGVSTWNLALPDEPSIAGIELFFQSSSLISVGPDVWEHSNGLEMDICP